MNRKWAILSTAIVLAMTMSATAWAGGAIDLPQTGQKTCYDVQGVVISCAGTGMDGESRNGVAWPEPRFEAVGECVTDNLTGLMWSKNANIADKPMPWLDSFGFVAKLNDNGGICGYTDWRVPNVVELGLLPNKEQADSASWLNTQGFENVQGYNYWTSNTRANHLEHAWRVQMDYGYWIGSNKQVNCYVWPVRGGN